MLENKENRLILFLGLIKLSLHFLTNTNHALHRDEYLYFDQGKHLAWGFYEVPPITPLIGSLADILGGSVFAIRLFPAMAGMVIILLACKLVKDLGGGIWGIAVTGFSLLLSTSLLGSNSLFQPVSFNQLCWFLIAYMIVQLIRTEQKSYYYLLGFFIGIGILTKYSVFFYLMGLFGGILLTKERKFLFRKPFIITFLLVFLLILPNIFWQIKHDFPVLSHMQELSATQLVHINLFDFFTRQLFEHKGFSIIWIFGLIGLFRDGNLTKYRGIGFGFLLTILMIGLLQGKAYYTLGAFPILFVFGGLSLEKILLENWQKYSLIVLMFVLTLPFYPLSLPILKLEPLKDYCHYLSSNFGIQYMLRWEDGEYENLPQDIADMHGWEELSQKVAKIYHDLPEAEQSKCMLYGGSYGHASSINYYRQKYDLPEVYSLNGSYANWVKEDITFNTPIMIDDRKQDGSDWFAKMVLMDSIEHKDAREVGYIYFRSAPKIDVEQAWTDLVREIRAE